MMDYVTYFETVPMETAPVACVVRLIATSLPTDPSWMVAHTVATALGPSVT